MEERPVEEPGPARRLDLLKALGDNTRYAIYLELARSPGPCRPPTLPRVSVCTSTPCVHTWNGCGRWDCWSRARTPRVGWVDPRSSTSLQGTHRVWDSNPPSIRCSRRCCSRWPWTVPRRPPRCSRRDVTRVGPWHIVWLPTGPAPIAPWRCSTNSGSTPRRPPRVTAQRWGSGTAPSRDLARSQPQVVCSLHRGLMEGFAEELGGAVVESFCDLSARTPCRADMVATGTSL